MFDNASNRDNGTESAASIGKGTAVTDENGHRWRVSDPNASIKGQRFIWLESPDGDDQRGIGLSVLLGDDWEVLG